MKRHLAQLNIAKLRHPIDDPRIRGFRRRASAVNGAGEQSPGYVWRLQSDSGDATDIQVFDDPLIIVNLTVWESLEALKAFAYRASTAISSAAEPSGSSRARRDGACGGCPPASCRPPTTPSGASTSSMRSVSRRTPSRWVRTSRARDRNGSVADDARAQRTAACTSTATCSTTSSVTVLVVAEIDDVPVACGGYRMLDDSTAEIKRMYVAQAARGMRVGAAIVAELEAAARARGHAAPAAGDVAAAAAQALEKFGFRHCPRWASRRVAGLSVHGEDAHREPSRLA